MSELERGEQNGGEVRCPQCDAVIPDGAQRCVMCGAAVDRRPTTDDGPQTTDDEAALAVAQPASPAADDDRQVEGPSPMAAGSPPSVVQSDKRRRLRPQIVGGRPSSVVRRPSSIGHHLFWPVAVLTAIALGALWLAMRDRGAEVMAAFIPTTTPLLPTTTLTPTLTPLPTETLPPSATPEPSLTPAPTSTPRDPRFHTVSAGETLFGLSLFYRVSAESIAQANDADLDTPIQSGQSLVIPWPTATPPLESVLLEINGEPVLADATDCEIITIQSGDSAYGLSAVKGVPLEAIIAVNRQTQESISLLQPGDTLCIPRLLYGDTIPPTPGPSPTPSLTPPPGGPSLLYPVDGATLDVLDAPLALQWAAVKDLAEDEWYMVEVRDLDDRDSLPHRGFTRDPSFRVPVAWRPDSDALRQMQWVVSIVRVTGRRSDGGFTYTFGGRASLPSIFHWQGAVPSPTPAPTLTPTPAAD